MVYVAEFTAESGGVYEAQLMATTPAAAVNEAWSGWSRSLRVVYRRDTVTDTAGESVVRSFLFPGRVEYWKRLLS